MLLTIFLLFSGILGVTQVQASPSEFTHNNAFTNIKVENTSNPGGSATYQWDSISITADWRLPDPILEDGSVNPEGTKVGDTFGLELPKQLTYYGALGDKDLMIDDHKVGVCKQTPYNWDTDEPAKLLCTITDLGGFTENLNGKLAINAQVRSTEHVTEFEFNIGTEIIYVPVPGGEVLPIPLEPRLSEPTKNGWVGASGNLVWRIAIPSSAADSTGRITVSDKMLSGTGEPHELASGPEGFKIKSLELERGDDGRLYSKHDPEQWTDLPADYIEENTAEAGETSFSLKFRTYPGELREYRVEYETKPSGDVLEGDRFVNEAKVETTQITREVEYQASVEITANGDAYTRFSISKQLEGEAVNRIPDDTTFKVSYTVNDDPTVRTVDIYGLGNVSKSIRHLKPAVFTIKEIELPAVPGISWDEYAITGQGVVDNGDGTYTVDPGENQIVDLVLTNKASIKRTQVTGSKVWEGGPSVRPEVTLQLFRNGVAVEGSEVTLADGQTSATWSDLEETDFDGNPYVYTVDEVDVPDNYTKSVSDDGLTVTNTYTPGVTTITGSKVWEGGPSVRPEVTLQLFRNGVAVEGSEVTLADGQTSATWSDLEETDFDGNPYVYTVDEVDVPDNYTKSVSDDGLTVTNTYTPGVTTFTATKVWEGVDDDELPEVDLQLYQKVDDGSEVEFGDPVKVSADSEWSYTWTDLPTTDNSGTPYSYRVDELNVPSGFNKTVSEDGSVVTNTRIPDDPPVPPTTPPIVDSKQPPALPLTGASGYQTLGTVGLIALLVGSALSLLNRRRQKPTS
ncbi:Cna B-type domain-containing protein [Trueperella bialowiezensis]|uniref:Collagen adhesin n=1 Tax=Trueperella bialowiezensis TaxID=312285 RepID=A0A448PGL9_9ACTO|nr:Cna B-type domain-containing protein [Trueperella bialowiezensis]VEI14060.1 Collagen adhesin precursor [Trueperella bialowiezensis]